MCCINRSFILPSPRHSASPKAKQKNLGFFFFHFSLSIKADEDWVMNYKTSQLGVVGCLVYIFTDAPWGERNKREYSLEVEELRLSFYLPWLQAGEHASTWFPKNFVCIKPRQLPTHFKMTAGFVPKRETLHLLCSCPQNNQKWEENVFYSSPESLRSFGYLDLWWSKWPLPWLCQKLIAIHLFLALAT